MADIEERAKELAGNHRSRSGGFSNMLWSAEPEDGEKWALLSINHRGADTVTRANAAVIEREVCEQFPEDAHIERFSDWLVGSTDNLVLRVYTPSGDISHGFEAYYALERRLQDYPLLDEDIYSEMEAEEIRGTIKMAAEQARGFELREGLPEDWVDEVWRALGDYDSDIRGGDWWPREEHLQAVLAEKGYLAAESPALEN